jgi:D-alanine-D-alanine ligase-like ATP-grasp enzyme
MHHLRAAMLQNTTPIYFMDWCLFSALGMEQHIGNLQFICATDTFDGQHPHIFAPKSFCYDHSLTSEQTLNALLSNAEVAEYIKSRGKGKLLVWLLDEETERLATDLGLDICLPSVAIRKHWDNKANTNRLALQAGVPCVEYVLSPIENYAHLRQVASHLGEDLVVQTPHGMSGTTTFFISHENDFETYKADITHGEEMRIMRRINCRGASLEGCITKHGVVVSPLLVELIGIPELTVHQAGWCGNEFLPHAFPKEIVEKAKEYTVKMGEQLRQVGYKGYFQPDFLIDEDGTLYLGEMNLRFSGLTPTINNANIAQEDIPLMLLHLAEYLNVDYELDIEALNQRWMNQANLKPLSFLHIKNIDASLAKPIPTGIYSMEEEGQIAYARMATSPQFIEADNEIFWFSSAGKDSIIEKGDEIGAFFMRSRATIDGKTLTENSKNWIKGLKAFGERVGM